MNKTGYRILVVDDEAEYTWIIQTNLEARGYEVLTARNGRTAVELAGQERPDLIILDIRMADLDGYEVCRRIRGFSAAPIIMLTAKSDYYDKVKGLDMGADDYVTKPFNMDELLARVRAALRRIELRGQADSEPVVQTGNLVMDWNQRRLFVDNKEVHLTISEYRLLNELMRQANHVLTADQLLETVWGVGYEGEYRLLRQVVYRLRQKVEADPKNPQYIQTRAGLGYIFVLPEQEKL